jgi:hypothetical protein
MASILEVHNVKVYGSGEKVVFLSHGFGTGRSNGMHSAASVLSFADLEAVRLPHMLRITKLALAWKRFSGNYIKVGQGNFVQVQLIEWRNDSTTLYSVSPQAQIVLVTVERSLLCFCSALSYRAVDTALLCLCRSDSLETRRF